MSGPFNVKSPVTGLDVYSVDGSGNSIQDGYTLTKSGLILPASAAPNPALGSVALYSPDGTSVKVVGNDGNPVNLTVTGTLAIGLPSTVTTAPVTVTGTTALTQLADGIVIPAGGNVAGSVFEYEAFGVLTTTVNTQTVNFGVYLGGIGGTLLVASGAQNPNSSGAATNQAWWLRAGIVFLTATTVAIYLYDHMSFLSFSEAAASPVTVGNTTSQELVIGVTNSAAAVSVTVYNATCRRVV